MSDDFASAEVICDVCLTVSFEDVNNPLGVPELQGADFPTEVRGQVDCCDGVVVALGVLVPPPVGDEGRCMCDVDAVVVFTRQWTALVCVVLANNFVTVGQLECHVCARECKEIYSEKSVLENTYNDK